MNLYSTSEREQGTPLPPRSQPLPAPLLGAVGTWAGNAVLGFHNIALTGFLGVNGAQPLASWCGVGMEPKAKCTPQTITG